MDFLANFSKRKSSTEINSEMEGFLGFGKQKSLEDSTKDAALALESADILLVVAGAGFSADSGLSLFKYISRV